jgi:TPP-dependent indolepyruvate ferredoxin oxidoreductase alpha subunit
MKNMTNQDVLTLRVYSQIIEKEFFNKESKWEISRKVFYAVQKFLRKSSSVQKEVEEITKDIQKVFKEDVKFDESKESDKEYMDEINKKFAEYFKENNEALVEFQDANCEIDFHGFSNEDLDEVVVPTEVLEQLLKLVK